MEYRNNANELTHHGILGMKWGVRRYQNKDGSLTPAGKRKAAKMKEKYTELTGKRLVRKPTKKSEDQNVSNKKKSIKDLSDAELRDKINRLQMEKQAKGLESDLASNGQKFATAVRKDVLAPAAIEAGKRLLTDLMLKVGKEKLGLNPKETKDTLAALKKEVDELELKKRKSVAEDYFNKRNEKKEKDSKKESKKDDDVEFVKTEFVGNKYDDDFKKRSSRNDDPVIIDTDDYMEELLKRYKSLPVPRN